jgi:hypothetical protein
MVHQEATDTHISILHHIHLHRHLATYHIIRSHTILVKGVTHGQDQMQAIRRAVTTALAATIPTLHPSRIILWLPHTRACEKELTHLSSLSEESTVRALLTTHLDIAEYHMFDLRILDRRWPGTPMQAELRTMELEHHATLPVTAWLPRPGIRTYIFLTGLPTLLS